MRARVAELTIHGPGTMLEAIEAARNDLIDAGGVDALVMIEAPEFSVAVVLAEEQ